MGANPPQMPGDDHGNDNERRRPLHVARVFPLESQVMTFVYDADPPQPPVFTFTHERQKGLFNLTWADGRVERFRDKPARQLAVEADPATGELRPAIRNGLPIFQYLCREEREQV